MGSKYLRRSPIDIVTPALVIGYPMGVFGSACVATCAFALVTVFTHPMKLPAAIFLGASGGGFAGLITGGPVFALLTVWRPVRHAWIRVFGACAVTTTAALAVSIAFPFSGQPMDTALLVALITLLVGTVLYVVLTPNLRPTGLDRTSVPEHLCHMCHYDLRGLHHAEACPECGDTKRFQAEGCLSGEHHHVPRSTPTTARHHHPLPDRRRGPRFSPRRVRDL